MCILSIFIQTNGDFILTQNRDESIYRPTSPNVETREFFGRKITGPVDLNSGGTWIYYTDKYTVCVLNGGYENHSHRPPYRMSRGLVILELLKFASMDEFISEINLDGIEPFTMLMIDLKSNQKQILVWDGKQKFVENLNDEKLIVRSSSTLYNASEKLFHKEKFEELEFINYEEIYKIHQKLAMPKNEKYPIVQSTSITQIIYSGKVTNLKFCPIQI
ncbi:NRDE family protein [Moheibacter sediminis]|uniref:Transport and Golgi organisation 2 n=1 Tax=Moheibacter sediminis TaxID=1434700 RepID=A0A1W2ARG0_9FLAO|nr:NRDE family protein [Moheibacter sediminis]SMC63283.1 Transport and Golgi organisation 2 [Moheibacter sediminis]